MSQIIHLNQDIFNTQHFGLSMANLDLGEGALGLSRKALAGKVEAALVQAREQGIQHITSKVDTSQKEAANALLDNGFSIADTLVSHHFTFGKAVLPPMTHQVELDDVRESDLPALKRIARESFKIDRFHSDPSLPDDLCDSYYEKWLENSTRGFADRVLVARHQGEAVGFTTKKLYPDRGYHQLVLGAVSGEHRGLGIYTSMIHESVRWAIAHQGNAKYLLVGTQIDNIAVQRAWARLGFVIAASQYVLQRPLA